MPPGSASGASSSPDIRAARPGRGRARCWARRGRPGGPRGALLPLRDAVGDPRRPPRAGGDPSRRCTQIQASMQRPSGRSGCPPPRSGRGVPLLPRGPVAATTCPNPWARARASFVRAPSLAVPGPGVSGAISAASAQRGFVGRPSRWPSRTSRETSGPAGRCASLRSPSERPGGRLGEDGARALADEGGPDVGQFLAHGTRGGRTWSPCRASSGHPPAGGIAVWARSGRAAQVNTCGGRRRQASVRSGRGRRRPVATWATGLLSVVRGAVSR